MAKFFTTVNNIVIEDEMQYDGVTLLTYRIQYPEFKSDNYKKSLTVINKYYKSRAMEYQQYIETDLYQMAVEQYLDDIKNGFPVRVFAADDSYEITYNKACILSLYFDRYEFTGGAHGNTIRTSQTWNLQTSQIIKLSELFDCLFDYRTYIKDQVIKQIEQNPDIYFDNYEELVEQTFDVNNFYCTPQGVIIYFQQYDIAPYASGIREFLLPYNNCVKDPVKKCI
ncbi:MAG TPA: DUF3298 and DUF4163 domain-containing protein [Syntrophomonadaceae bacterium]|nr:DUF3298 and DUF4163 domain-containing protein [Syntrophomonadaceae bacterium]HNX29297.1 DUF3298 and DUF4163 domain-containing protein [Syntrophomonadaceae bacterium]HPR92993.1 DUF3298 and DUF4163 domain-containing protein [Syntrophomonadaceae bacterium]